VLGGTVAVGIDDFGLGLTALALGGCSLSTCFAASGRGGATGLSLAAFSGLGRSLKSLSIRNGITARATLAAGADPARTGTGADTAGATVAGADTASAGRGAEAAVLAAWTGAGMGATALAGIAAGSAFGTEGA